MIAVDPIRDVQQIQDMLNLLAKKSRRDAFLFRCGINVGLRIMDILRIRVCDVMTDSGKLRKHITLQEMKTGKTKKALLNKVMRREIPAYIKHYYLSANDYLFFSYNDTDKYLDRTRAYRILKAAAVAVGIENFGTHSMRKTLAYHVYEKTRNIGLVMRMLNHKRPGTTLRYLGIRQQEIDEAYEEYGI